MLEDIQGQIERVTFHNEENGFTIARLKVKGFRELVTAVGSLMAPVQGQVLDLTGEWTTHPQFGEQFRIVRYKTLVPATVAGIEKYLGSGLVKGIGPVMAKRSPQYLSSYLQSLSLGFLSLVMRHPFSRAGPRSFWIAYTDDI